MTSIAELGIKVDSTDAAQASSDLDKLTAAGGRAEKAADGVAKGADKASKAIKNQREELADLLGEIDPTVKALGRLDDLESKLSKQKKLGALDASTFSEYQAKIDQSRNNLTKFDDSLSRTGNTAKQTAAALRGVPAQFTDIAVSLQGGQAPLTVLLQQGGQLKDMFGGIGPAAKALGGYVAGLINPFTLAAAAIAAVTLAYYKGSAEADEYNKSLILTGNYAGTTSGSLASMAKQVSATAGTTGAAAAVLSQLAGSGNIAAGSFEEITKAALIMQQATGKAVEETVAEFASIAKEPVAASIKLNEQYHYLTASVYEQIVALEKQGNEQAAVKVATDAFADAVESRGDKITQRLGLIEGAWNKVAKAAKWAWDSALDVGREATYEEKLADLEKQAQNASRLGAGPRGGGGRSLTDINADKTSLMLEEQERRNRAQSNKDDQDQQERSISARQRLNALIDKGKSLTVQTAEAYAKIDKDAADAARKGAAYSQEQIAAAKKAEFERINGKPSKAAGSLDLTSFNDTQNQLKALTASYSNSQKELEAQQKAGIISQESYAAQRSALIQAEKEEVTNAYQAEISALEATRDKSSTSAQQRIQLDQKIADARTSMVKAQKDADTELSVLATNEQGRLAKQERSINSYVQALGQQQKALELAGQRAVLGVGRGDRENSLSGELNSQQDRFAQQALDLENQRSDPSRNMSDEEYAKKSQALADANKKATDQIRQNYADVETAQGDWTKGATSAWENYLDSAKNIAGQTKNLFTNAFSSMEDAVVNFALTGKLSFSDFAKSILADMARIATRQASSSLLSSLVGAGVNYFAGGGGNGLAAGSAGAVSSDLGASQAGYSTSYFRQAKGGAWMDGVKMFANGGAFTNSVVSSPTAFGMSGGGTGVMGEAGPEAIMPLTRTSSGALGVRAMGGGGSSVQISAPVSISVEDRSSEGMELDQAALAQNLQVQMKQAAEKAVADSWRAGGVSYRQTRT